MGLYTDRDCLDYGGTRELQKASARPYDTKLHRRLTAGKTFFAYYFSKCTQFTIHMHCCAWEKRRRRRRSFLSTTLYALFSLYTLSLLPLQRLYKFAILFYNRFLLPYRASLKSTYTFQWEENNKDKKKHFEKPE